MTPIAKWWKRVVEKHLDRFYEGPRPPARLSEMVATFAQAHPEATRREWVLFATSMADESYRSGFVRGFEHLERDRFPPWKRDLSPDDIANREFPEWDEWSPDVRIDRLDDVVPEIIAEAQRKNQ